LSTIDCTLRILNLGASLFGGIKLFQELNEVVGNTLVFEDSVKLLELGGYAVMGKVGGRVGPASRPANLSGICFAHFEPRLFVSVSTLTVPAGLKFPAAIAILSASGEFHTMNEFLYMSMGTTSCPARLASICQRRSDMLYYALVFLVIALVAAALGFGGIAGASVGIAKILFFVFIILFVLSLIFGGFRRGV
jgi:uncharacterized membrane protein YtjA (UPF0391 family)